jgi:hypothetical protein
MCRKANHGNLKLEYSDDWPVSGQFKLRFSWRSFSEAFISKCLWMWGATGKEASHKICLRRTALAIPEKVVRKTLQSIPGRAHAVVKEKGGHIPMD